jgi:hypothetical protein
MMTSKSFGIVLSAIGSLTLLCYLVQGGPQGEGAYLAIQVVGLVNSLLLLGVGAVYLARGINETDSLPKRKKRRGRRPHDEGEDG